MIVRVDAAACVRPFTRLNRFAVVSIINGNGRRSYNSLMGTIEEGDVVLLRRVNRNSEKIVLTSPLKKGQVIESDFGKLNESDIIGVKIRDEVISSTSKAVRVRLPTLAEYVTLTPRIVTPIYPADANLIVSLLDIHVTPTTDTHEDYAPLEILEAGTGHGSLTLHLARAIHAANAPYLPTTLEKTTITTDDTKSTATLAQEKENTNVTKDEMKSTATLVQAAEVDDSATFPPLDPDLRSESTPPEVIEGAARTAVSKQRKPGTHRPVRRPARISLPAPPPPFPSLLSWKTTRRAIVHTLDASELHSRHAEKIVHGFRNGLYAPNVDFHVNDVSTFISQMQQEKQQHGTQRSTSNSSPPNIPSQIFHHILLDLPGVHSHLSLAASSLHDSGTLIVFAPSITQIGRCVELIRKQQLPLSYEQVVELGAGYSGGRQWDVRAVNIGLGKPVANVSSVPEHLVEAYGSRMGRGPGDEASAVDRPDGKEDVEGKAKGAATGFWQRVGTWFFGSGAKDKEVEKEKEKEKEKEEWVMVCRPSVGYKVSGGGFVGVWRRKKGWVEWKESS